MHAFKPTVSMLAATALWAAGCATAPSESSREMVAARQPGPTSRTLPRWQTEAGAPAAPGRDAAPSGHPSPQAAAPAGSLAATRPSPTANQTAGLNASNRQTRGTAPPGSALTSESGKATPSLQDVIAEIESLGSVNPEVQKRLLEELRHSDPALWPMLTQQIRATLAYQQQQASRQAGGMPAGPAAKEQPAAADARSPAALANSPPPSPASAPMASHPPAAPDALPEQTAAKEIATSPGAPAATGAVKQVSYEKETEAPADWNASLAEAIQALELQTREAPKDGDGVAQHARLRMLYLIAGRRDDALQPIPGASTAQQQYWSEQLYALSTYLDSQRIADPGRRAAETVLHLSHAAASLGEQGPLVVKNLNFCTEVISYGVFKRVESHDFKPGQQALIYAEVENFKSEEMREGFHTALQSSYQILDSQGRRVAHDDFALTEEHCQNRRRDYFVRYFLTLPGQMYDGQYTLELTVEDTLGRKIGQSTVQFAIKTKTK